MQAIPPQQGAPQQGAPQQASPPGGQDSQAAGAAEKAVDMIKQGYEQLGQLMQSAGSQLDPQDIKLFHQALQATDLFIQALTSPSQGSSPAPAKPGGPMPMNANAQSKPAPQY